MEKNTRKILLGTLIGLSVLGVAAVGGWYGFAAWEKSAARKDIEASGENYSEANFIDEACKGNAIAVFMYLKSGMSVNVQGKDGITALHCAAKNKNTTLPGLLISGGADINALTEAGQTPLMEAARSGNVDTMKILVDAGAKVNEQDKAGNSALMLAAANYCRDCKQDEIELLLSHGADAKLKNKVGANALTNLVQSVYGSDIQQSATLISKLIKQGADVNAKIYGTPLLSMAIQRGNADLIKVLLDAGADVNSAAQNETPLMSAVRNPAMLRLLLEHKANPNLADANGNTPLFAAIRSHSIEAVQILLDAGANASSVTGNTGTALHVAAQMGDAQIVGLLLKRPIDPEARDARGDTVLLTLARNSYGDQPGRSEIARMLLSFGANANVLDREGKKPADIALERNAPNLASVLAGRPMTLSPGAQTQPAFRVPSLPSAAIPARPRSYPYP